MKSVRSLPTMKSTIDCVDSAWVTFLGTSLPCPATVGPYAVWPSCSSRSITGCHREPSWQPPCTSTNVYESSVSDCGSSTLTAGPFTIASSLHQSTDHALAFRSLYLRGSGLHH